MEIDYPDFGVVGTRCVVWTNSNSIQIYNRRSGSYERRSYSISDDGAFRLTSTTTGTNLTNLNTNLCTEDKFIYHPDYPLFFSLTSFVIFGLFLLFLFNVIIKKVFNL